MGRAAATAEAFRRSGGEQWGVLPEAFAAAVDAAVAKRFGGTAADGPAVERFIDGLHADDLALACACAAGHAAAWDHFVLTFRPELYRAARAMSGDAAGRELADSLYADLYGLPGADGHRRSLFTYYHGRARLGSWLRSVLAQRHVDVVRGQRRQTSLDDPGQPQPELAAPSRTVEPDEARRMAAAAEAVSEALAKLEAPDRLRLAYYYVHGLTLAQAGSLLGEHEATASRKLERARKALRQGIASALAARGGRVEDIESWGAVARHAWDAALSDALGVDAPRGAQADGALAFNRKKGP